MRYTYGSPQAAYQIASARLRTAALKRSGYGMGFAGTNPDIDRGREILEQYYSHMVELYGVADSFDDFLTNNGFNEGFLEGLGLGANAAEMSASATDSAMKSLALQGHGMVPKNKTNFSDYLINQAVNISAWTALKYTVTQTATDIGTGVQKAGDTLLEAGKAAQATTELTAKIIQFAPIIGVGLIGYLMYISVRRGRG